MVSLPIVRSLFQLWNQWELYVLPFHVNFNPMPSNDSIKVRVGYKLQWRKPCWMNGQNVCSN